MIRRPRRYTLFPYTTLFRSIREGLEVTALAGESEVALVIRTNVNSEQREGRLATTCGRRFSRGLSNGCCRLHGRRWRSRGRRIYFAFQRRLLILQSVHFFAKAGILIQQLLQHPCDVVQFVEALQNIVATITRRPALIHGPDGFACAARAHRPALLVGHGEHYAAVHPTRYVSLAVAALVSGVFGVRFASRRHFNLVRGGSVLHHKIFNRGGSSEAEFLVILRGAEIVGAALHFDAITRVLMQQVG